MLNQWNNFMINANKQFLSLITNDITYNRVPFELPDLSGEQGNPMVLFSLVSDTLSKYGYKKEAQMLTGTSGHPLLADSRSLLFKTKYEDQPNLLNRFVHFDEIVESEDDDFIYIKKRKPKNIQQPDILIDAYNLTRDTLAPFIHKYSLEERSTTNNYGRNLLYYVKSPGSMKKLLEMNENNEFVDIEDYDVFGQTILHASDNLGVFNVILAHMLEHHNEFVNQIFNQHDVFGNGCFITLERLLSNIIPNIQFTNDDRNTQNFKNVFKLISYLDDVNQYQEFFDQQIILSILLQNRKDPKLQENARKFAVNLSCELQEIQIKNSVSNISLNGKNKVKI